MQTKAEAELAARAAAYAAAVERENARRADLFLRKKELGGAVTTRETLLAEAVQSGGGIDQLLAHRAEDTRREEEVTVAAGVLAEAVRQRMRAQIQLFAAQGNEIIERDRLRVEQRLQIAKAIDAKIAETRALNEQLNAAGDELNSVRQEALQHEQAMEYAALHSNTILAAMPRGEWPKVPGVGAAGMAERYDIVIERVRFQRPKEGVGNMTPDLRIPLLQHEAISLGLPVPAEG